MLVGHMPHPGNKHISRPLLAQVNKKIFDADVPKTLIPRNVPSKTISLTDHRAIGRGREKKKNRKVMRVGRLSQFLLSKREMDAQGISYLTHEE